MKTYYYSIYTKTGLSWSQEKQYSVDFSSWSKFAEFCKQIAKSQQTEIRASESAGTNNQGHYFHWQSL